MQNLLSELKELLKKDERLMVEDELLKNKVIELALKLDESLIRLLLSHARLRQHFFTEVDSVQVFDKGKFVQFVSNKAFLPDSYTAFANKIGLTDEGGRTYLGHHGDVVLAWPYKDCVLEGGQTEEDAKRDEIFWNVTLAPDDIDRLLEPKVLTNFSHIDKDGEQPVTKIADTENLIIKGNNLLASHCLLPRFRGRVKLIYIDPPFNRETDTFYNDSFKHSTWLTFMSNRLEGARQLLGEDGAILVHIDDEEYAYLKVLMDELFGRENFINTICIRDSHPSGLKLAHKEKTIIKTKSYVLAYKMPAGVRLNPLYQKRDDWDTHFNTFVDIDSSELPKYRLSDYLIQNGIVPTGFRLDEKALGNDDFRQFAFRNRSKIFQSTEQIPKLGRELSLRHPGEVVEYQGRDGSREFAFNGRRLSPLSRSIWNIGFDRYYEEDFAKLLCDFWDDVDFNNLQNEGGVSLPRGKKPEYLLARLMSLFTDRGEIVLDYYLGCGTTAAVAHKMGRQYIGIEQLDYGENDSIVRLKNVISGEQSGVSKKLGWQGGGSFTTCELMRWNARYIDQIHAADGAAQIQAVWETIRAEAFLSYKVDLHQFDEHAEEFAQLSIKDQKRFLLEVLDKNHLYVNLSEIDDADYHVAEEDKRLNRQFYRQG